MEDWKERLVEEQEELKKKVVKLVEFINSEKFYLLDDNYKKLLLNQKVVMEEYLYILNTRLYKDINSIEVPQIVIIKNKYNQSIFVEK